MNNSKIKISSEWTVKRDEFYDVNPWDNAVSEDTKFDNIYVQEDMLWITLGSFNLNLGWYGGQAEGFFGLYLYRGEDWHNCQLLEKRTIRNYDELIDTIHSIIKNVEAGRYVSIEYRPDPMDEHFQDETVITIDN